MSTPVKTLTPRQARKALEAYKTAFVGEVYWLAELVDFAGWKALGHASAEDLGEELGVSRSTLWRQVEQGRVVRAVSQGNPKLLARVYVTQRQAAVLGPMIEAVGEPIRHRIEEGEDPSAVFADVVAQLTLPLTEPEPEPEPAQASDQQEQSENVAHRATSDEILVPSGDTLPGEDHPSAGQAAEADSSGLPLTEPEPEPEPAQASDQQEQSENVAHRATSDEILVPSGDTLPGEDHPSAGQAAEADSSGDGGVAPPPPAQGAEDPPPEPPAPTVDKDSGGADPASGPGPGTNGPDSDGSTVGSPTGGRPGRIPANEMKAMLRKLESASVEEIQAAGMGLVARAAERVAAADDRVLVTREELIGFRSNERKIAELQQIIRKLEAPPSAPRARSLARRDVTPNFKGGR